MAQEDPNASRRARGAKAAIEAGINVLLPYAVFSLTSPAIGVVPAMMAATAPPLAWTLVQFVRERKIDAISLVVLAGIVLSLLGFLGGGGVKVLQLRENLVSGLVGLAFLGSAAIGRPLIFQLARAGVRRRAASQASAFDALGRDAAFRAAMTLATLVWGLGLVAVCALEVVLVYRLSIRAYLLVGGPVSYGAIALMTAWTFWFVPRAKRRAEARASS